MISTVNEENAREVDEKANLETDDFLFKFAFGVRDANSNKVLDDESLISWAPILTTVTSVGDVL